MHIHLDASGLTSGTINLESSQRGLTMLALLFHNHEDHYSVGPRLIDGQVFQRGNHSFISDDRGETSESHDDDSRISNQSSVEIDFIHLEHSAQDNPRETQMSDMS